MPIPTPRTVFERKSLREGAADQIKAAIFDGSLTPGELLNDQELQNWLGVSRTPIREALNDLARIGLIEMSAQRFTRVAAPSPQERDSILQTLGAVVGGIVRVTTPTLTASQRRQIAADIDHILAAVAARDAALCGTLGRGIVDTFIKACPNPVLVSAVEDIIGALMYRAAITRTADVVHWNELEDGLPRLRTAVLAGDAIEAELAAEHILHLQAAH